MKPAITFFLLFQIALLNAQWNSLKCPYGGNIYDYANAGGSSYLSTANGLFRSDDNGNNWIRLENNLPEFYTISSFCTNNNEVFVSYYDVILKEYGFAYSNDQGATWTKLTLPEPSWHPAYMTYSGGLLLAAKGNELFESNDKGSNWKLNSLSGNLGNINILKSNDKYFFVVGSLGKVYRRSVSDTIWNSIIDFPDNTYSMYVSNSLLLVASKSKEDFRSLDNGTNWQAINFDNYYGNLYLAEFGDTLYYCGTSYINRSLNRGLNWSQTFPSYSGKERLRQAIRIGNQLMAITDVSLLVKSNDGFKSLEPSINGLYAGNAIYMVANDSFLFVMGNTVINRFDLIQKNWIPTTIEIGERLANVYYIDGIVYLLSSYSDNIYLSKDNGRNFEKIQIQIIQGYLSDYKLIKYKNRLILYGGIYGTFFSEDYGRTWDNMPSVSDFNIGIEIYPRDFCINHDTLYSVGETKSGETIIFVCTELDIWYWYHIKPPSGHVDFDINEFYTSQNILFVKITEGTHCNIWKYDPGSGSFIESFGIADFCDPVIRFRNKMLTNNNRTLLLTYNGYYLSEDAGLNWIKVVDELANEQVPVLWDMLFHDNSCYATSRYGLLESNLNNLKGDTVGGFVYYDENSNAIYDANDAPLENSFIKLKKTNQFIPVRKDGKFQLLYSSWVTDTLLPVVYSKYGGFTPDKLAFNVGDIGLNFAFSIAPQIEDMEVQLFTMPRARPGFNYYIDLVVKNLAGKPCSGKLVLSFDPLFVYKGATVTPDLINNNLLIWNFSNLALLKEIKIRVEFSVPVSVPVNTPFKYTLSINDLSCNDIDLSNNQVDINDKIVASCDPNEMVVDKSEISKAELENKTVLTYTIRFQNTGNHEAEFVKLRTFIANYDLSTLSIKSASHPFSFAIANDGYLEVYFDMIHLPDSLSDESQSHGYFSYSISPVPKNVILNRISAYAAIYFDYNKPISTNNAVTDILEVVSNKDEQPEKRKSIVVVPNPNHGEFRIYSPYLEKEENTTIQIFNLQGECVYRMQDKLYDGYNLDLGEITNGIYFLKIGNNPKLNCKFVVAE